MSIETPIDGSQLLSNTSLFCGIGEFFTSLESALLEKTQRVFVDCVSSLFTNYINPLSIPLPEFVQKMTVEICSNNIISDEDTLCSIQMVTNPEKIFMDNSKYLFLSVMFSRPEFLKILKLVPDTSFFAKKTLEDGAGKLITFCVEKVDLDTLVKGHEGIERIKAQSQKISKLAKGTVINSVKSTIVSFEQSFFKVDDLSLVLF